ncbi:RNA-directed DNA polymerase, eukaryota, reverse transcriptase zinc-binding domain protein [Tanacetum coccineum]
MTAVVASAASSIGCATLTTPFNYLGVKVGGGIMSRLSSWDDVTAKLSSRLSKQKLKTLSIGGRLTLEFFNSSLYIHFQSSQGLGVSSFFALNRAFLFKWIWRFISNGSSLWPRFIKAIYGVRKAIDNAHTSSRSSLWLDIIREFKILSNSVWLLRLGILHLFLLLGESLVVVLRRSRLLVDNISSVFLSQSSNGWVWRLDSSGDFSEKSARCFIDDSFSPKEVPIRWVKFVPIKDNIFDWKVCLDKVPTRLNLSLHGLDIPSVLCPLCSIVVKSTAHLLFFCHLAR